MTTTMEQAGARFNEVRQRLPRRHGRVEECVDGFDLDESVSNAAHHDERLQERVLEPVPESPIRADLL